MEGEAKKVVWSNLMEADLEQIFHWGTDTFGSTAAYRYTDYLLLQIDRLNHQWYLMHPECRHLATKNRIYRNIITDSHLVIYRVVERVEVLRILHSSSSIESIRKVKGVKV